MPTYDMSCTGCCEESSSSSPSSVSSSSSQSGVCEGECILEWDGASWVTIKDDCPGFANCTQCDANPPRDGNFVGETYNCACDDPGQTTCFFL